MDANLVACGSTITYKKILPAPRGVTVSSQVHTRPTDRFQIPRAVSARTESYGRGDPDSFQNKS